MAHLALFRKYRSQSFDQLSGQDHVTVTLRNALRMRMAGQAYLFCGPRGTGKTSTARIFAKSLNCLGPDPQNPLTEPPEQPCNQCVLCDHITAGACLDVSEMDAASNTGVDNIRDAVIGKADFAPVEGRRKVYIIDEVHKLSSAAFAALLKTLEEPPPHLVFILATTDPHEVPATILSRCQRFDFRRIGQRDIVARLRWICEQESLGADDEALAMIAEAADGSLRDALVILEQAAAFAFTDGRISPQTMTTLLGVTDKAALFRLSSTLLEGRTAEALQLLDELILEGRDLVGLARDLLGHVRALLIARVAKAARNILKVSDEQFQRLDEQAQRCEVTALMRTARVLMELEQELKDPVHARLNWEVAIIRLAAEAGAFPSSAPPPAAASAPSSVVSGTAAPVSVSGTAAASAHSPAPSAPAHSPAPSAPAHSPAPSAPAHGPAPSAPAHGPAPSAPAHGPAPSAPAYSPAPAAPAHGPAPVSPPSASAPGPAPAAHAPPPPPQAPMSAPASADPASAGGPTLQAFREAWNQMLDTFKRERKGPLAAKCMEAHPSAVEGDVCVVAIPSKFTYHHDQIVANKAEISGRLSALLHTPVRLEVRVQDGPAPGPARPATSVDPQQAHAEFVQESQDIFGGKIV